MPLHLTLQAAEDGTISICRRLRYELQKAALGGPNPPLSAWEEQSQLHQVLLKIAYDAQQEQQQRTAGLESQIAQLQQQVSGLQAAAQQQEQLRQEVPELRLAAVQQQELHEQVVQLRASLSSVLQQLQK